jgi:hypothetical protein
VEAFRFFLRRNRKNTKKPTMAAMTASPPITPPTIAPTGVFGPVFGLALSEGDPEVLEELLVTELLDGLISVGGGVVLIRPCGGKVDTPYRSEAFAASKVPHVLMASCPS